MSKGFSNDETFKCLKLFKYITDYISLSFHFKCYGVLGFWGLHNNILNDLICYFMSISFLTNTSTSHVALVLVDRLIFTSLKVITLSYPVTRFSLTLKDSYLSLLSFILLLLIC